jgi:transposase
VELLHVVADPSDKRVPEIARACLAALGVQLFDRMIMARHRSGETSRRLDDCPGVGPALATALVATVADPKAFQSGRNFSAWIGLVPKQHSPVNSSLRSNQETPPQNLGDFTRRNYPLGL